MEPWLSHQYLFHFDKLHITYITYITARVTDVYSTMHFTTSIRWTHSRVLASGALARARVHMWKIKLHGSGVHAWTRQSRFDMEKRLGKVGDFHKRGRQPTYDSTTLELDGIGIRTGGGARMRFLLCNFVRACMKVRGIDRTWGEKEIKRRTHPVVFPYIAYNPLQRSNLTRWELRERKDEREREKEIY